MEEIKWYEKINYQETKALIREKLENMSRTFIATGYYLRLIKDSEGYKEDGYRDIYEFAEDQYGIKRTTTSRWMAMNEKFSKRGNSPILADSFKEFSKSQLQEMLYLNDSQIEQITPDMTVKAIREVRKVEEIEEEAVSILGYPLRKYPEGSLIATPGCGKQNCFSCHRDGCNLRQEDCYCVEAPCGNPFPCATLNAVDMLRTDIGSRCQFVNEDLAYHRAGDGQPVPCCKECNNPCGYECRISSEKRYKKSIEKEKEKEVCDVAQNEESNCPPGITSCIRQEWGTSPTQQHEGAKECAKCWNNWKKMQSEHSEPEQIPTETLSEQMSEAERIDVQENTPEVVVEAEYCEIQEEKYEEPTVLSDLDLLKKILDNENEMLNDMKKYYTENDVRVRKQNIKVVALTGMLCDLENIYVPDPEEKLIKGKEFMGLARNALSNLNIEIDHKAWKAALASSKHLTHYLRIVLDKNTDWPELPKMKNVDQRKKFLENYETWPIWFDVPEASETYYRFDLPDKSSIVVCEYCHYVEWRKKYGEDPEMTYHKEYLLKPGYKYLHDCETNQTALLEHLKNIQKGK